MLIGILLVPGLVFLFMKGFGENKFAIPVFYSTTEEFPDNNACENKAPYSLPALQYATLQDSTATSSTDEWKGTSTLLALLPAGCENCAAELALIRSKRAIGKADLRMLKLYLNNSTESQSSGKPIAGSEAVIQFSNELSDVLQCQLLLAGSDSKEPANQLILLDKQNRIRGYYNASDREEIDRLIQELQILFRED